VPIFVNELQTLYCDLPIGNSATSEFPNFVHHTLHSLRELDQESYWNLILENSVPTVVGAPEKSILDLETTPHQLFVGMPRVSKIFLKLKPYAENRIAEYKL
jgi:hypothetical protein